MPENIAEKFLPYEVPTRTQIERGDVVCIRWRIDRKLLESIDKNYFGFGSRTELFNFAIKEFINYKEDKS